MAGAIRVTGAWTRLLADWLDQEGLPAPDIRAALAQRAPDDIVPIPAWRNLLERAVALRPGLPAPGLAIGALVQPQHVGVLGYLVLASTTVGEAMLAYRRYEQLFYGVALAEIALRGDQAEIRWPREQTLLGQLGDAVAISALITFLRRQVDNAPAPTRITFVNPEPPDAAAYEAFFGCPVQFNDSHTRVQFPLAYMAIPMPHGDPGLQALLKRQADALLAALPDSDAFDRALQQHLLKLLSDGKATLPEMARALNVSVRTLQRRLDARNLSWQQVLDRTRAALARQYLADAALSLGDIALLLGFSEQSAFTRAFGRWTGQTPARWRRQVL